MRQEGRKTMGGLLMRLMFALVFVSLVVSMAEGPARADAHLREDLKNIDRLVWWGGATATIPKDVNLAISMAEEAVLMDGLVCVDKPDHEYGQFTYERFDDIDTDEFDEAEDAKAIFEVAEFRQYVGPSLRLEEIFDDEDAQEAYAAKYAKYEDCELVTSPEQAWASLTKEVRRSQRRTERAVRKHRSKSIAGQRERAIVEVKPKGIRGKMFVPVLVRGRYIFAEAV